MTSAGEVARRQAQVAEMYRRVRASVERNQPLYDSFCSGSLPEVELTEEQRAIIAFFPHQLHELEELRLGRMPSQSLPRATPQPSPAGHGGANNSNNNTPNPPAPRRRRAASTHSSEAASDSDAFPSIDITATTPIEEVVEALVARYAVLEDASPSKRRRVQQEADELLERFIEARSADAAEEVDTAEKALKAANDVKKKLMSGSKQPSKQQAAMIEQLPQLRKRATVAKRKKQKEEELLRERVLAEVAEIAKDADDDANVDEELAELDEVDEEAAVAPAEDGAQKSAAAEEVEAAVHDSAASAEVQASTEDEGYSNPMTHSPDPTITSATLPEAEADAEEQEQEKEEEKHVLDEPTVHEADATAEPSDSNAATSSLEKDDAGSPLDLPVSPQSTRGAESVGSGHGTSNSRASTPTAIHPLKYRPDSGEPFTLSTFKAMIQPPVVVATATPTPASAAAAAAAQEEKKEGAVVPPTPALPEEAEVEPCARLGAELAALMEDPVPGVGIHCTRNYPPDHVQLLAQWHLLVSPRDGPFAGLPIPLTVAFPVRYPHLAPQVHVWVPMPHSALMVSEQGQKNSIFLSYAPPRRAVATTTTATTAKSGAPRPKKSSAKENGEWHVDLGARDVLVALQDIFNDASFSPMRRAIGHTSFDEQIHAARVAIARCCGGPGGACRAKTAHWPHAASPSLMNGPFVGMASVADDETEEGRRAGRLLNGHAREGRLAGPWKGTWLYVLRPSSVAEAEAIVVDGGAITSGGGGGADPLDDVQLPALYLHMEDHHANTTEGEEAEARPVVSLVPLSATQLEADAQARSSRGSASPIPQWVGSTLHKKESDAQPLWELPASAWSNSEAHVRVVRHNTTTAPSTEDASTTTVPLVDREDEAAGAAAFAVVVDVPAGHQLRITFSTTSSCVPSSSSAVGIDAPRLTKEFVQRMWPEAYDLLDPDAAYQANSARNTGLVVELPYGFEGGSSLSEGSLPTRLIKAFGVMEAASYFVPRRVAFSWARGTLPLAMTNTRFESLRATMRRFRPAKAGTIADNFIAHGADDLARRLSREEVEAHPITTPAALLSASTELFWGPRAVFIPMLHLEGNGDAASPKDLPDDCRETLQRFLRTCTQLYRHPTASVAYCPPTRPSAVLHFLALVAQTVLKQHNKSEGEGLGRAYLGSVLEHVLALLTMLAKMVPALHKHLVAVLRTYVRTEGATLLFQDHLWLDGERPSLSHTGKDLLSRVAMLMGGTTDAAARYLMELHILGHLLAAAVVECVAPTDAEDDAELPPTTEELLSSLQQHPCPVDAQPSPTSLLEAWKTLRNTRA